jgi:hypothetical protein
VVLNVVGAINTLVTAPIVSERPALALTTVHITCSAPADGTTNAAPAVFTAIGVRDLEVPVSRFACVTDPSTNSLLALTQLSIAVGSTATQRVSRDLLSTGRITAAFLAAGVIVVIRLALVACQTIKCRLTVALSSLLITGNAV